MYRDHPDPWAQSTRETYASEKAVALNLIKRLRDECSCRRIVEIGCGFGDFTSRIANLGGLAVTGIDISETAVKTAVARHPGVEFATLDVGDHAAIGALAPDVIVMAEVTWYVLEKLYDFVNFLRHELSHAYLIHLLSVDEPGVQKYGREFFTDLEGIKRYFGMNYLESGSVSFDGAGARTWFLGKWRDAGEA